jgi:hypothetical protein
LVLFGIQLNGIKMLVEVPCHLEIFKSFSFHQFAIGAPVGIYLNQDFFWLLPHGIF